MQMTSSASTAVIVRIPFLHYAASPDFLRSSHLSVLISVESDYCRYNNTDINLVQYRGKSWHYSRESHCDTAPFSSLRI